MLEWLWLANFSDCLIHPKWRPKTCVRYFLSSFYFSPIDSPSKTIQMFFISSKRFLPVFLPISHCFRGWSKINLKVYDIINCLNKNLITHFIWYLEKEIKCDIEILSIDRVLNKKHIHGKTMQKMCTKSYPQTPF